MNVSSSVRAGLLFLMLLGTGCHSSPETLEDLESQESAGALLTKSFWKAEGVPPLRPGSLRRVALAEFTVEFVLSKWLLPGPGASVFDPFMYTYPTPALGHGIRLAEFGKQAVRQVPRALLDAFTKALRERGVELVKGTEVGGAAAYKRYETTPLQNSSFLKHLNPVGTDTGRIRHTKAVGTKPLGVVLGPSSDLTKIDAELLAETRADAVLRVRLRVGIHKGRASLESGSRVAVTTGSFSGVVSSHRSLISNDEVLRSPAGWMPFRGFLYKVDSAQYLAAIRALAPKYLELGMQSVSTAP